VSGHALWAFLADPWSDPVTRRALLEVTLLGLAGGALGCWIVLYGLSYSAESLAHGMLPGLVVAALVGAPLILGGAAGVATAAVGVALAGRSPVVGGDTAVAVVVTTLLGLGVLLALSPSSPPGLGGLLFGDILGVTDGDLALAAGLVVLVGAVLWALHPRLAVAGFDRANAPALGVSPWRMDAVVLLLVAAAVVVAAQGLGNLLVVAVLVGPAATARRLARRLAPMLALSAGVAVACGIAGLYVSYHARTAAGASVAVAMVLAYLIALAATARRRITMRDGVRTEI
jgi:ABC-type Mn2+/Zn2+ transport system permease subunit